MVVPPMHSAPNVVFVPHPPGMQFGAVRAPVPNSFVPMQVTRQSVHQQPRSQRPNHADNMQKKEPKVVQKSPTEKAVSSTSGAEAASAVVASTSAGRAPNQERHSSSKPPGSRLAIRFNGP